MIADGQVVNEFLVKALHQLNKDAIMEIATEVEPLVLASGAPVFHQGQTRDCFYIVLDGECDVVYQRPGGGETLIDRRIPGDYFGEAALIHGSPRNATVRAGSRPVRLLPVSQSLFDRLLKESPNFRTEMERVAAVRSLHVCEDEA